MSSLDRMPAKRLVPLVTFSWGATPTTARYARWDEDALIDGTTFKSAPEMSLQPFDLQGGASDSVLEIDLLATRVPVSLLSRPFPFPVVVAVVEEADPDIPGTRRVVFRGVVTKSTRNSGGMVKLVRAQISGTRARLVYPLGLIADTSCAWTFADAPRPGNCGIDPATVTHTGLTISAASGNVVTIPGLPSGRWAFGSVVVDALGMAITETVDGGLRLFGQPPPEWVGAACTCVEGCDKSLVMCRAWNNEARFGGMGIGIPAYMPLLETPT